MSADHPTHPTSTAHPMADRQRPLADDARLDALARTLHGTALQQLSPRTRARLAQAARHPAAARALRPHPRPAWAVPVAFAALAVLAVALRLQPEAPRAPIAVPVVASAPAPGTTSDPAAALDVNPDFYLWLASTDDVLPSAPEH